MNKTAVKNFAIWARRKLISDITYKAGLLGISEKEIKSPLPQSTKDMLFFDIGTKDPYYITGIEIDQRRKLTDVIEHKAKQSDYQTAYKAVVEEAAYTWFNRLIAVRFMEVNDYLPSRIRVLSSESKNKTEPDLVTNPFDSDLDFTPYEKDRIVQLKNDNKLDELFRMLFIKQCNALNGILPELFEKTSDYTELLLNISFTDNDGIVNRLVYGIDENDFNVSEEGQVEIIGWMYQYYNTEPKDETFALLKNNVKITKERIPSATQLFTPDWIVRYMVENSLGRLWIGRERASHSELSEESMAKDFDWKYYLPEAEQEADVQKQLKAIREEYKDIKPESIKFIDPCMGSGHILVYAFDVLMQIYESCGYSQRDAATSIVEHNIYGLDIDDRAYQLAYFSVMMKARQYNRNIFKLMIQDENGESYPYSVDPHLHSIQESSGINPSHLKYFGWDMSDFERNLAINQIEYILDSFKDAKEYGSILNVNSCNWSLLYRFACTVDYSGQMEMDAVGLEETKDKLLRLIEFAATMLLKYDVVVTNPPYMGSSGMDAKLAKYVKENYPDSKSDLFAVFIERCRQMTKQNGITAMITQHAWMFLSSYEKLREKLLFTDTINMMHLGARAFDEIGGEVVQTTAFVTHRSHVLDYRGTYVRLVEPTTQQGKENMFLSARNRYTAIQDCFSKIPGAPIAYWVSGKIFNLFECEKRIIDFAEPRHGMSTGNNDMCLRYWFEVANNKILFSAISLADFDSSACKYAPYKKGGECRLWYGNNDYIIAYDKKSRAKMETLSGYRSSSTGFFFKPSINWSDVSSSYFGVRLSPAGFAFDGRGASMFCSDELRYYLASLLNTKFSSYILNVLNPTLTFNIENIATIPVIIDYIQKNAIDNIAHKCVDVAQSDWDSFEASWDFKRHPLITHRQYNALWGDPTKADFRNNGSIELSFKAWDTVTDIYFNKLRASEEELNRIFIDIYGLQDELTPEVEDKDVTIRKADLGRDIRSFISYAVGCMLGRYSLDVDGLAFAGGDWNQRYIKTGGLFPSENLFPSETIFPSSPKITHIKDGDNLIELTFAPDEDNVIPITDEEYFSDDIVGRFTEFVRVVYGNATLEENLSFIANALSNKGASPREIIRNYFLKDFFKDHCKIYQNRPVYWLFDSGKNDGFKALIYMHRYDENTVGNIRVDYLHRMQRVYESEIVRMQETIQNNPNTREATAAEKRKEKLTKQLKETKDYDEKVAHLALARIAIDLDDGVKVNYEKVQTGTDGKKLEVLAKI